MPYRDISVWLEDILMAIDRVNLYTKEISSFSSYTSNSLVRDATERNLEIVAEALKNALKLEPDLLISDAKKIIGLRNIINHQYYEIEHDRIWVIIKNHIPVLETEVKKILEDYERRLELNEL